jgi:DnaK suppressor protein
LLFTALQPESDAIAIGLPADASKTGVMKPTPPATVRAMPVHLPAGYKPSPDEAFMNPSQVEYFRQKLLRLRADAQRELNAVPAVGSNDSIREGDQADQASAAVDREFDIVSRERAHALLRQIERALIRIDNGTYGYCADTGEPIDLRRVDAQPTATLTTEAQAQRERSRG